MHLRTCELAPMGGELLRETMRGPVANLDEATGSSEIDVKTMRGSAPIDELCARGSISIRSPVSARSTTSS